MALLPFRTIVRLGSTTEVEDNVLRVELNTPDAIRNSSSKLLMKRCFATADVKTADWYTTNDGRMFTSGKERDTILNIVDMPYPIVAKLNHGSRNEGNTLVKTQQELEAWLRGKTLSNYIFEKFYNFNREYRLHVNADGCFYTCRKMLKRDTSDEESWFRNDSNSVWIMETNEAFDKPSNWDAIVAECVKATTAVGLDFAAVDLRIQSTLDKKGRPRKEPEFIVLETNSAPAFGEVTLTKYLEQIPIMLKKKFLSM